MAKKKTTNVPRQKRMNRKSRLQAAKQWIAKYEGQKIIRDYSKYFAVDNICAIKELGLLGVDLSPHYITLLQKKSSYNAKQKNRKQNDINESLSQDSDNTFYFIAGYTSGGAPYGVTWEALNKEPFSNECAGYAENYDELDFKVDESDDIPF